MPRRMPTGEGRPLFSLRTFLFCAASQVLRGFTFSRDTVANLLACFWGVEINLEGIGFVKMVSRADRRL